MGKNITGAGDILAAITKFAGIQPCEACQRRREKWNTLFPLRINKKMRELTEQEIADWKAFQDVRTLRLSNEQRIYVCEIYASAFNVPYYEPCPSCDASPYLRMIEKMDAMIKTYE